MRTAKWCLTLEQVGILYPSLLLSEHDKVDSCGDSEVITKPVDHCNGMEIIPQTTPLIDRLVYFPEFFLLILFILMGYLLS